MPLDDCLYALQEAIPNLKRSSLRRCLLRHGSSCIPPSQEATTKQGKFKAYLIGYLHLDFAEVRTKEGKQYLLVALNRTSKLAFAELHPQATQASAVDFLRRVFARIPYKMHK